MAKDQWSEREKGGARGRSRMNELLKSVKKERPYRQSAGNATRNFATCTRMCYEHRTMSSSHEKWIENIVSFIYIYIKYMQRRITWSNFVVRCRVTSFFFFRFFLFWKSLHFALTWPLLRSCDITFTCTLSVASMETWACVSIVSSSRARASRTYRSVSMNKRTKTRRCQK